MQTKSLLLSVAFLCYFTHISDETHCSLTSSVFVAQVWKSPNIGQVHSEANNGQEKVYFLAPSFSVALRRRSGQTHAVPRGGNNGGAGVLDTILVLDQYQFYLFFLHIALFQRCDRWQFVLWQDLDVHLLRDECTKPSPVRWSHSSLWVLVELAFWVGKNSNKGLFPTVTTGDTSVFIG